MQTNPILLNSLTEKNHAIIEDGKLVALISLPKVDESWKENVATALLLQIKCDDQRDVDEKNLPLFLKSANTYDFNAPVEIMKYGERYWAILIGGELLAVVLYRKGAEAIKGLIEGMMGG